MGTAVYLAFGLLVCNAHSQLCGSGGPFPGLLGLENGFFGPGPQFGPLAQANYAPGPCGQGPSCGATPCGIPPGGVQASPCGVQVPPCSRQGLTCGGSAQQCGTQAPCGVQLPPCAIQAPPCGIQAPPCGIQAPPCSLQVPPYGIKAPCGIQVPPCEIQAASCGVQVPPCAIQVPQYGIQAPCGIQGSSCGIQVPPCGIQVPPCGIQVPPCGTQAPNINSISPGLFPNQACSQCSSFIPNQLCNQCSYLPTVGSIPSGQNSVMTVVDNTLANSLANAIQLLIMSNLLESTSLSPCSAVPYSVCETANPFCGNIIEDYLPCNQIVTCEPIYETVVAPYLEVPCYQEPVVSYSPCEISQCGPIYGQDLALDNLINTYAASCGCLDNYGGYSFPNGYGCSDGCLVNSYNGFGCDKGLVNPYTSSFGMPESCGLTNPFVNGFGCLDSIFSPVAAEVLFPAEIPAQLTCNFGYMANNVPCVSVNVEPLPFESCSCNNGVYY